MAKCKAHPEKGYVYQLSDKELMGLRLFVKELLRNKGNDNDGVLADRFRRNFCGYMAEFAVCQHYGEEFKGEITPGKGDEGIDFWAGEKPIAVQSVESSRLRLLVEAKKVKYKPCAEEFVSCVVNPKQGRVWIRGVVSLGKLTENEPQLLNPKGHPGYVVENDELGAPPPPVAPPAPLEPVPDPASLPPEEAPVSPPGLIGEGYSVSPVYFDGPDNTPSPVNYSFMDRRQFYEKGDAWKSCAPKNFEAKEGLMWGNRWESRRPQPPEHSPEEPSA